MYSDKLWHTNDITGNKKNKWGCFSCQNKASISWFPLLCKTWLSIANVKEIKCKQRKSQEKSQWHWQWRHKCYFTTISSGIKHQRITNQQWNECVRIHSDSHRLRTGFWVWEPHSVQSQDSKRIKNPVVEMWWMIAPCTPGPIVLSECGFILVQWAHKLRPILRQWKGEGRQGALPFCYKQVHCKISIDQT